MVFCVSEFQKKMGEFAVSIEHSEVKSVSASGGLRPLDPPTRGSAPGPRWGLCPKTPVIGSRSARSPWPLCQILNTPLTGPVSVVLQCKNWCVAEGLIGNGDQRRPMGRKAREGLYVFQPTRSKAKNLGTEQPKSVFRCSPELE